MPRHESEKRSQFTPRLERLRIPNRRDQRSCGEPTDAWHLRDRAARRFLLLPSTDLILERIDIALEPLDALQLILQAEEHRFR